MGVKESKPEASGAKARLKQGLKGLQSRISAHDEFGDSVVSEEVFTGRRPPRRPESGGTGSVLRLRAQLSQSQPQGWYRVASKDAPVHVVVHCPNIARELLAHDDGGAFGKPPADAAATCQQALNFASDPAVWRRQREALRDAMGAPGTFGQRFGHLVDRAAAGLIKKLRHLLGRPMATPSQCILDLKPIVAGAVTDAVADLICGEAVRGAPDASAAAAEYIRAKEHPPDMSRMTKDNVARQHRLQELERKVGSALSTAYVCRVCGDSSTKETQTNLLQCFCKHLPRRPSLSLSSDAVTSSVKTDPAPDEVAAPAGPAATQPAARHEAVEDVRREGTSVQKRASTPPPRGRTQQTSTVGRQLVGRARMKKDPPTGFVKTASRSVEKAGQVLRSPFKKGGPGFDDRADSTPGTSGDAARSGSSAGTIDPPAAAAAAAPETPKLTQTEALHNAADYLIGGTDVITHLALMTLLHMSHDNRIQEAVRKEVTAAVLTSGAAPDGRDGKAVPFEGGEGLRWNVVQAKCPTVTACLRETMRLYPPVLSLRRHITAPGGFHVPKSKLQGDGGEKPGGQQGDKDATVCLRQGSRVTVCAVGAARAGVREPWRWDPLRPATEGGVTQGMPFGTGPRSCPSGMIAMGVARVLICRLIHDCVLFPAPGQVPSEVRGAPADQLPVYPWESSMRVHGHALRLSGNALAGIALLSSIRLSSLPPPTDGPEAKQRTDDLHPAFEIEGAAPSPKKGFQPRWKTGVETKADPSGPRPGFGPMTAGTGGDQPGGVQRMLWVFSAPHKPEAIGEYYFCPGERWGGMPFWVSSGGRVIYSESIGGEEPPPPLCPGAVERQSSVGADPDRSGKMPGKTGSDGPSVLDLLSRAPTGAVLESVSMSKAPDPGPDTYTIDNHPKPGKRSERVFRWLVGTRESMAENTGWLVSKDIHDQKKMPHEMTAWQRYDDEKGKWVDCSTTKVTDSVPEGWAEIAQDAFETDDCEGEPEEEEEEDALPARRTSSCPPDCRGGATGKREWG